MVKNPEQIQLGGRSVPWWLERDRRLKKIHLTVRPQLGLVVRAPVKTGLKQILKVLGEREEWLLAALAEVERQNPYRNYVSGERIPLLDGHLLLQAELVLGSQVSGQINKGVISLKLPIKPGSEEYRILAREVMEKLYRKLAQGYIPARTADLNREHFGFSFTRITIRGQQKRLGSCSALGKLNFNWRLMLAPSAVLDYVIIHELAHLCELNHSPNFWSLVAKACPDYQLHRKWLRNNGPILSL